jgi:hypothetical protein
MGIETSAEERRQADCVAKGGSAEDCAKAPAAAQPKPVATAPAADCKFAEMHWNSAEDTKTLAGYEDHLARYPNCAFATRARARIEALQKKQ